MWTFWYIREASTAFFVANIPHCWSLVRRMFKLRSFNGTSNKGTYTGENTRASGIILTGMGTRTGNHTYTRRTSVSMTGRERISDSDGSTEHLPFPKSTTMSKEWEKSHRLVRSESEEEINKSPPMEIWQSTNVTIEEHYGNGHAMADQHEMYDGLGAQNERTNGFKTQTVVTAAVASP